MKPLQNNILLYDSSCPLCMAYSQGFIAAGMLDKNGRMDYAQRSPEVSAMIDPDRARNEIALVNIENKTVVYGIHSLFSIISHSFPILSILFNSKVFSWVMKKFYAFVSYNRRVIICGSEPENPKACNPDFNLSYRIAYLVLSIFASSWIVHVYSIRLVGFIPMPHSWLGDIGMVTGQLIFQVLVMLSIHRQLSIKKILDYTGNVMTISLMGSLLLLPILIFDGLFLEFNPKIHLLYFMLVVGLMFLEHKRRVKIYYLPSFLSYSWVGYRLIVVVLSYLIYSY